MWLNHRAQPYRRKTDPLSVKRGAKPSPGLDDWVSVAPLTATDRLIGSIARIATHLVSQRIPPEREFFFLIAALVEAAQEQDVAALSLSLDGIQSLGDLSPKTARWEQCVGRLQSIREVAWLLRRSCLPG